MKKRYILTFLIPIILAAILAWIITPNAETAFLRKMSEYNALDNCYMEINIIFQNRQGAHSSQRIEQYKSGGKYFAKYYQFQSNPTLISIIDDKVSFGDEYIYTTIPLSEIESGCSVFMLDKISADNIVKGSVKRDNSTLEDKYDAQLIGGNSISVTFNHNLPVKIEYKNISYSNMLVDLFSQTPLQGDVTIKIPNIKKNTELDKSYILTTAENTAVSLDTLKSIITGENDDFEDNEDLAEYFETLKRDAALLAGKNYENFDTQEDFEDEYDDAESNDMYYSNYKDQVPNTETEMFQEISPEDIEGAPDFENGSLDDF